MRLIERLSIIGVGLIGASFALALKEAGAVGFVTGHGRTKENLQDALAAGALDDATTELEEAVEDADVVMLAAPVRSFADIAKGVAHLLKPGAIVTDAGSTKEVVMDELLALLPSYVHIVPGHPIAGSEKTGAVSADAGLFRGRRTILTPGPGTDEGAVAAVSGLWKAAGASVEIMEPALHDVVMGAVSHLPHMAAYGLVETLMKWDEDAPMLRFSAGGFRDFTRIASSSPEMWRDICLDNRSNILEAIDRFTSALGELRAEVDKGDGKALVERFERARKVRDRMGGGS